MKKVFFVFAVAAGVAMTACNNKPAENAEAPKTDSTVVTTAVSATTDTTAAKPATDSTAAAPATETKTETKSETKTEKKETKK